MLLKIDQEFKNLIPPLTHEERALLEKNIIKEGCRDPIVVWDGVIIDGHNRHSICTEHDIEFKTANVELSDRNEAINWIIDNQLGKRNVPEQVKKYLIGKRYTGAKKSRFGRSDREFGVENITTPKTAEKIAEQNQVSEKTVRNSETFSESIDKIADSSGKNAMDILTTTKVTQEDVKKVSTFVPEVQKEIVDKVMSGKVKSFKEALKPIIQEEKKQELEEIIEENPDTDYCACTLFLPLKSQVTLCPCGCGYGYCETNEKWYDPKQINELDEE